MRPRSPLTPPAMLNTSEDIQNVLTVLARTLPVMWAEHTRSEASTIPKTIDSVETLSKFLEACC